MHRAIHIIRARLAAFAADETAVMSVWGIFWTLIFLGLGGLAVDMTNARRIKTMLQVTADAASQTAAYHIDDPVVARNMALQIAEYNMPAAENHGAVLIGQAVEFGRWDPVARSFTVNATPFDAARVTVQRAKSTGNVVPTPLLKFAGFSFFEINATSVHLARYDVLNGPRCRAGNFAAAGTAFIGSLNTFDAVCLHGENGLTDGGGGHYQMNVQLSAPNGPNVPGVRGGSPATARDVSYTGSKPIALPAIMSQFHSDLIAEYSNTSTIYTGTVPIREMLKVDLLNTLNIERIDASATTQPTDPVYTTGGAWVIRDGNDLDRDTLYLVNGDVRIAAGANLQERSVGIIASGDFEATAGAQIQFHDTAVMVGGNFTITDPTRWGPTGSHCLDGTFNSYLYAGGTLAHAFNGANGMYGAVVASSSDVVFGSGLTNGGAIQVEAAGGMSLGGSMSLSQCSTLLDLDFTNIVLPGSFTRHATTMVY